MIGGEDEDESLWIAVGGMKGGDGDGGGGIAAGGFEDQRGIGRLMAGDLRKVLRCDGHRFARRGLYR